ncbi:ABC transporter substrate-binding protein [Arthrobacter sp. LAPM80]|uniref:ABC transporter substrate-binding protein n=1 Tax=Arthrobacter sp. LAPM80 TaxID=3141788 RepID=UPI00398AA75D
MAGQFPDNIVSAYAPDAQTVVFTTGKAYSEQWMLYNQLGPSKALPTYPLWQVVDGPWTLKSFNADGLITFGPNAKYSDPVEASLKEFIEVPFTTDAAEFNVLGGATTIDFGYLPTQGLSAPGPTDTTPDQAGPNPLSATYALAPWNLYGANYFPINSNNPTVGPIFKPLYLRQALQSVVDQRGTLTSAATNHGVETTGPCRYSRTAR